MCVGRAAAAPLDRRSGLTGHGWQPVSALGLRNATYRPGRSVLSIAVIASATFILISVDAFRRDEGALTVDRQSGGGGYTLVVETLLPIAHDPNTREGRDALNLRRPGRRDVRAVPAAARRRRELPEPV